MFLNSEYSGFPYQKRSTNSKGKQFCIDCVEAALGAVDTSNGEGLRESKYNMQINYNMYNDILDENDVSKVVNPWNLEGATFPAKMQNYPLLKPKVDLLVGEETKRRFDWRIMVTNSDAISQKEKMIREKMNEAVVAELMNEDFNPREAEEKLKDLDKWSKYEAQDLRERRATQYLQYLWKEQELQQKFTRGFYDALIAGEEGYNVDVIGGEPVLRKCNPLTVTLLGIGHSHKWEDADIIIEDNYIPIGQAIDKYYEYLTPSNIDTLERGDDGSVNNQLINYNVNKGPTNPLTITGFSQDDEDDPLSVQEISIRDYANNSNQYPYDTDGNIREVIVSWRSRRKLGEITWYDEEGNLQEKIVDENYKPVKERGEDVEWFWVNEWWQATRLGKDIYVKWGPRPVQFRHMSNKSLGGSGYVGTLYNVNVNKAQSLYDVGKPYQYLYNVLMYRTEMAFAKSKGKIGLMDLSMIPDDWELDKWLYYAEVMGWAPKDPFNEGVKGAATGKLAGTMNQNQLYIDLEMGNYISMHIQMLQFIEVQLGQVIGISRQREGNISTEETVGGVERAVTQSSHTTEKWFYLHDDTKRRVLEVLQETAKYAWRNKKNEKLQYVSDELSNVISEIDGEMYNEAEYGIMVTSDSSKIAEFEQVLKQLAHAGIQNDKLNFSTLLDIYFSESISSMRRKIEKSEEITIERQERQFQQEMESITKQVEAQKDMKNAELSLEDALNYRDNQTKLQIAGLKDENEDGTLDIEKLRQNWMKMEKDYNFKNRQLDEIKRHNKATEIIAKSKPKTTAK